MESGLYCYPFKIHWLLYVLPALTLRNYILPTHCINLFQQLKSSVSWYITPCVLMKVSQCFKGVCHHHLEHRRISYARNQLEA
jgi:hypothetical protein